MLNWPPFVLHKIHRRNYFFQTADFVQNGAKTNRFFECHTPTSSRSQYLSEKSSRSSVTNPRSRFFQHVTSSLTNTTRFHYDRPMSPLAVLFPTPSTVS